MRWYAIHHLYIDDVPVVFRVGDRAINGRLKIGPRGGFQYWIRAGKSLRLLPKTSKPWCWRPECIADWPARLPSQTIQEELPEVSAAREAQEEEELEGIEKILNPDFRLGHPRERPQSRSEAESRFLRCLLTDRFMERLEPAIRRNRTTAADWPREFVIGAKVVERNLRSSRDGTLPGFRDDDYNDIFVDKSDCDAKPIMWEPTRRDIGDWELDAPRWGRRLSRIELKILRLRCARWSYRGISSRTPLSYEAVRLRYNRAIDKIWREARA